jgi:PiT family inorganic phosphate transporter
LLTLFLVLATCFLAYSNGANDNFKGVASLFGSRTTSYRTAIAGATLTTFAGSMCSLLLAQTVLFKFSARGIVPDQVAGSEHFLLAVALGAGLTVILATITGFPVSTTHGLIGAIIGSGVAAAGPAVNVQPLASGFLLPLVLGPILAVMLAPALFIGLQFLRCWCGVTMEWCICVGERQQREKAKSTTSSDLRAKPWPPFLSLKLFLPARMTAFSF